MADIPDFAYILFDDICDIIGPSEEWPEGFLKLFWTRNLKHWDRFVLCCFIAVNGLNPEVFMEWVDVMHLASDYEAVREFKSLLNDFTNNASKWTRAYGYHVLNHCYEYVSGTV